MDQTIKEDRSAAPGEMATADLDLAARRRAAVELLRNHERALRRTARRYSYCADDAEDAFQRAFEIVLKKAPTAEPIQLLRWTQTVTKHEALAVRSARARVLAAQAHEREDDCDWLELIAHDGVDPDERVERRELIARSREALGLLKPQELRALTLLAEGYSYKEIGQITGWSQTKVNRCLVEGRQRFRSMFDASEAGERCNGMERLISSGCDGEATPEELAQLRNHLDVCGGCRSTLRAFKAAPAAAAALAPLGPVSRPLWDRAQEAFAALSSRWSDRAGITDMALSGLATGGGARGAGMAALAKVLTVCVGAAGGVGACVATGVVPSPIHDGRPHPAAEAPPPPVEGITAHPVPAAPAADEPEPAEPQGRGEASPDPNRAQAGAEAPVAGAAPQPTVVEQEFTPESAGTPIPPPPPTAPVPTAPGSAGASAAAAPPPVPVGGGGEFGP